MRCISTGLLDGEKDWERLGHGLELVREVCFGAGRWKQYGAMDRLLGDEEAEEVCVGGTEWSEVTMEGEEGEEICVGGGEWDEVLVGSGEVVWTAGNVMLMSY